MVPKVAKQKLPCQSCGGSYEDNPSGRKRHQSTGKHQTSLVGKFAAIDPDAAYPPKPTGLIVGGAPYSEEELALGTELYVAGVTRDAIWERLDKAVKDLDYWANPKRAGKVGGKGMANKRAKAEDLRTARISAIEDLDRLNSQAATFRAGRSAINRQNDEALNLYVSTMFSTPEILVRGTGNGSFRISGVDGRVAKDSATGEDYPVTLFGYEATVYGPDLALGKDLAGRVVDPAHVGWGSMQMRTLEDARRMLRIFEVSIEVATVVNELYGIEKA